MEERKPPLRIVSLGRVYRPDTADATHYPMFHQVEGLLVEPGTTMAHLKNVLRSFASSFLGGDVRVRFRPSFFLSLSQVLRLIWSGMAAGSRWVEQAWSIHRFCNPSATIQMRFVFAFGLGVERIAARRFGVADIRDFYRNDIRFLEQFHDRGQA